MLADLVSKLGLRVEKQPEPYALHWLSHRGIAYVHKLVQVPLTIGDYINDVFCDIGSMDATHLILGRPW